MTPERYKRIRAILDRRQPDLTVALDQVHKPFNLSAILRSSDAVGVPEVHAVAPGRHLWGNPTASAGSARWVDLRLHETPEAAYGHLRARGMQIVLAHESAGAEDFRAVDYTRPTAIVLGAERDGPSSSAIAGADRHIRIPMAGMAASLNVSAASAVILYEAQRQRSAAGLYREPRLDPATYWRLVIRLGYPEVARRCDARGLPYPILDERDGSIAAFPETRSTG